MTKLVGISGTHGTGKSTIINGLEEVGFEVVKKSISRSAQALLGWDSLSLAGESEENMWVFQNAILDEMIKRDALIKKMEGVISGNRYMFVERSPADVWAYLSMWCKRANIPLDRTDVVDYLAKCKGAIKAYDLILVVHPNDKIPFIEDPHRENLDSRVQVENCISKFLFETVNDIVYHLTEVSQDRRTLQIVKTLNTNFRQREFK